MVGCELAKKGIQSAGTSQINRAKNLTFDNVKLKRGEYRVKDANMNEFRLFAVQWIAVTFLCFFCRLTTRSTPETI